ncbi:MAG: thioredoxin-disulfide reductase [Patescibacteria group bacterium]|nr:thioredoxin-disulfide reductase [Patescibacteria group bacterium]
MEENHRLAIIGSGPAGLTAAIYAARGNLNPVVISGRTPGGQLTLTTDVDDFPGFPEGIQGRELMLLLRKQAEKFGTKFIEEDVISVDFTQPALEIKTESQKLSVSAVIIASGASAKWLGLPSEQRLIGRGVSACAVCDGPFFKDKKVVVVGGGDAAMREAQHLSKYATSITVVHRRETLKAQAALQKLVKQKPNVTFLFDNSVEEVLGEDKVTGVKIKNLKTGVVQEMETDGVFVAIGHRPNTDFLKDQLKLNDLGYIVVTEETRSSIPGVFIAGDVADWHYRQAVTAAGAGCKAALDAEEYLEQNSKLKI